MGIERRHLDMIADFCDICGGPILRGRGYHDRGEGGLVHWECETRRGRGEEPMVPNGVVAWLGRNGLGGVKVTPRRGRRTTTCSYSQPTESELRVLESHWLAYIPRERRRKARVAPDPWRCPYEPRKGKLCHPQWGDSEGPSFCEEKECPYLARQTR